MANPHVHAKNSVRRYGGKLEDYVGIHAFMDSSKGVTADNRHRVLTHTPWFAQEVIPKVYGDVLYNSDGKPFSPKQVAFDHIEEDFRGYIPTAQDWIDTIPYERWMQNGAEAPPSNQKLSQKSKIKAKSDLSNLRYD